jgi:hypothetical protein
MCENIIKQSLKIRKYNLTNILYLISYHQTKILTFYEYPKSIN